MKLYKFQALVTLWPASNGGPGTELDANPRRMVVRARHRETHHSKIFSALVTSDGDAPVPGSPSVVVTLRLTGDDVPDYLDIGEHFDLWRGGDIGQGIISRRLFT